MIHGVKKIETISTSVSPKMKAQLQTKEAPPRGSKKVGATLMSMNAPVKTTDRHPLQSR
jgi:hypothetical protein